MILIFWFVLLGPGIGGYLVALLTGDVSIDRTTFLGLFVFSYIYGVIPAIVTAIMSGILLWSYKKRKEEIGFGCAILIGSLSGLIVGMGFLVLDSWSMNQGAALLLGHLAIFVIPGAVCGIFNKIAWRQLSA